MLERIPYKNKNYLFIVSAIAILVICYKLAFKNTYEAIVLNHKLNKNATEQQGALTYNPGYLKEKRNSLNQLVNRYTIDTLSWKNEFWFNVSRIALKKGVNVSYIPAKAKFSGDSVTTIARQEIIFEGAYKQLVSLIDTLESAKKIGLLSSLTYSVKKENGTESKKKLYLTARFTAVEK